MKTTYVPPLVMLSAGLVDCIICFGKELTIAAFLKELAIVLLIFYVIGVIVKIILDKAMQAFADTPEEKKDETAKGDTEAKAEEKK